MKFKTFQVFGLRREAEDHVKHRSARSDVGTIVFLMLALVFAPIAIANAAVIMNDQMKSGHAPAFAVTGLFATLKAGTN